MHRAKKFYSGKDLSENNLYSVPPTYILALEFRRPQNVSQNREKTWTAQFSTFELLEALLSGWNFTQRGCHPLGWILLFQTTPLEDFLENVSRSFSRSSKGKGNDATVTTARFGELLRFRFFALHFLSFPSHWMNLLTLLKRASLAGLTKFSWFKPSTLIV